LLVGTLVAATVLLANVAISFATDSSSLTRWLGVPVTGTVAAIVSAVAQWRRPPSPPKTMSPALLRMASRPGTPTPRSRSRRWLSAATRPTITTAVVAAVLLLGVGGTVVATATRYGMDWFTGNEHGPDRLVHQSTATASGLTVTVTRLEQTSHFTRLSVAVVNDTGAAISLPLGNGNVLLVAGDGTTRRADPFRSEWNESIGTGATRRGVITFAGHLPADSTRARLTFAAVFGYGDAIPNSFTVPGIHLTTPH
jgi:hypothetical protein